MANTKVQSEQIEDGSITADKLADGTIVAAELADNAVTTAKINADAVTGAKIADDAIDSEHYTDGSIDTAHIADAQITVAKMAANSVDSDQYVDGSIDTVHLGDLQVTTAKIANGNISTAKIADNAVTSAKIDTNIDIAGTFDVTGATTLDSTLAVAGDANFDSGTLFVDVSANKVGIGTTSPLDALHISSAVSSDYRGNLFLDDSTTGFAAGVGGQITFGAEYRSNGDHTEWAAIQGAKANSTDANYAGTLEFKTRANGGALQTKMVLDDSGNLLVGTTDTNTADNGASGDAGHVIAASGYLTSARSNDTVALFNRMDSDGPIIDFRKNGSIGGMVNIEGGDLAIGNDDAGIQFVNGTEHFRPFNITTNAATDAVMDIGSSSKRFKDLYLSGGAYVGGTAAANKLDDYEEGTFTASLTFGGNAAGISYVTQIGKYTKIGNTVHCQIRIKLDDKGTSTGIAQIALPFAASLATGEYPAAFISHHNGPVLPLYGLINASGANAQRLDIGVFDGDAGYTAATQTTIGDSIRMSISLTYKV